MDDLEERLKLMGQGLRASAPPVADVSARSRTVRRRRQIAQLAGVAGAVAVVAVGAVSIGALLDSPPGVVVGPGEDDPSQSGGPPSDQLENPGGLDVGTQAGRLVVQLEIVPGRIEALRDVHQALGGGEGGADPATGPEWVLLNAGESEVSIEFGSSADLEHWTGDGWVALGPLPSSDVLHGLPPGSEYRGVVPLVEIPDFDVFVEASASGDVEAVIDAHRALPPGWYRLTKTVTPVGTDGSEQDATFEVRATFQVVDPDGAP